MSKLVIPFTQACVRPVTTLFHRLGGGGYISDVATLAKSVEDRTLR